MKKETYEKLLNSPVLRHVLATKSKYLPNMSRSERAILLEIARECGVEDKINERSGCGICWYKIAEKVCKQFVEYENAEKKEEKKAEPKVEFAVAGSIGEVLEIYADEPIEVEPKKAKRQYKKKAKK